MLGYESHFGAQGEHLQTADSTQFVSISFDSKHVIALAQSK